MKTISEGMGAGLIKHVELGDVLGEDWVEFLTLDLKIKASKVFLQGTFPWHSPNGLCAQSMGFLNEEFNRFRGLFPLKVFVTGPPASGKTHFSTKLAESYGVPHVKIGDLISQAMKFQTPFGDELRAKVEELKDVAVAEYEKTRNKKKDPELDRATVKVRLPDEMLYKIVRMHMNTAACKNKGFIVDGYPRTQADAKAIFFDKVEEVEGQEPNPEDQFPGYTINTEVLPQYVIVFQGDDAALKQRVKEMAPEKTLNTHYNEAQMDRRLKIYRDSNVHDSGQSVQDLFSKAFAKLNGEVPISENLKVINSFAASEPEIFGGLQDFIEKNGKPCCLNLITEKDNKFHKNLAKQQQPASHAEGGENEEESKEHAAHDDEDDELA